MKATRALAGILFMFVVVFVYSCYTGAGTVEGPNLVRNGGFTVALGSWPAEWPSHVSDPAVKVRFSYVEEGDAPEGNGYIRFKCTSGRIPGGYGSISQWVSVQEHSIYRLSAQVRTRATQHAWIGGGPAWEMRIPVPVDTDGAWQAIQGFFVTDAETTWQLVVAVEDLAEQFDLDNVQITKIGDDSHMPAAAVTQDRQVIFAAVNLEAIPQLRQMVPQGITVAGRIWDKNATPTLDTQAQYLENQQIPYYITAVSSDFVFHASLPSFYYPLEIIDRYLDRPSVKGVYLHELLAALASQRNWNWGAAAVEADWSYIERLLYLVRAHGKAVVWSEPSRAWQAMWSTGRFRQLQSMADSLTLLYATNFPNDIAISRRYAGLIASTIGCSLGVSIQDWFFVDQHLDVSADETERLLQDAEAAGATVYQVEGTSAGMRSDAVFMQGILMFLHDLVRAGARQ